MIMNWYKKAQEEIGSTKEFTEPNGRKFYVHYHQKCSKCQNLCSETLSYDNLYVCSECGGRIIDSSRVGNYVGTPNVVRDEGGSWDNMIKLVEDSNELV